MTLLNTMLILIVMNTNAINTHNHYLMLMLTLLAIQNAYDADGAWSTYDA